jgi:hypothetical protein
MARAALRTARSEIIAGVVFFIVLASRTNSFDRADDKLPGLVFQIHPNGRNQCHAKADAVSPTPRCNPLILREPGKIGRHFLSLSRNLKRFPGHAKKGPFDASRRLARPGFSYVF